MFSLLELSREIFHHLGQLAVAGMLELCHLTMLVDGESWRGAWIFSELDQIFPDEELDGQFVGGDVELRQIWLDVGRVLDVVRRVREVLQEPQGHSCLSILHQVTERSEDLVVPLVLPGISKLLDGEARSLVPGDGSGRSRQVKVTVQLSG